MRPRTRTPTRKRKRTRKRTRLPESIARENSKAHDGGFQVGNELWKLRATWGPKPKYPTPESLWSRACEYFQWADDNPLLEMKVVGMYYGKVVTKNVPHRRPYTLGSLFQYLDISKASWSVWRGDDVSKRRDDLINVMDAIDNIIQTQKFEGAATGFFNANIISRDLGLVDKSDMTTKGKPMDNKTVIVLPAKRELPE